MPGDHGLSPIERHRLPGIFHSGHHLSRSGRRLLQRITNDILTEVTQYAPTTSCVQDIGYLACYGAGYQQMDCRHSISPDWPSLCANYTACLAPAGRQFIAEAGLCTNISAFLNRPVSTPTPVNGATTAASVGLLWLAAAVLLTVWFR